MAVPRGRALQDAIDIALERDVANARAARMAWHLEALMEVAPEVQFVRWVSNTQRFISSLKTTVVVPIMDHFPELRDPTSMPYRTLSRAMRVHGFCLPGFKQAPILPSVTSTAPLL
jgi:hypothetical protein